MKVSLFFAFFIHCILADSRPSCLAPNGGGVQPIFEEFTSKIPTERIGDLITNASASCSKIQAAMEYLSSSELQGEFEKTLVHGEMLSFMSFTCNELYLDMYSNLKVLFKLVFPRPKNVYPTPSTAKYTGDVTKLLVDIIGLIPFHKIKARFQEKSKSDPSLGEYLQKVHSNEFKLIREAVKTSEPYGDLDAKLLKFGVEIKYINAIIQMTFFDF